MVTDPITDPLISIEVSGLGIDSTKEEIVKFLLDNRLTIEAQFPNDEYLKFDLTHGELLGLKSTAVVGGVPISDITAISWVIKHTEKYKEADIINLGNVKMLYENLG
jgi:hypothetical protein